MNNESISDKNNQQIQANKSDIQWLRELHATEFKWIKEKLSEQGSWIKSLVILLLGQLLTFIGSIVFYFINT